MLDALIGKKTYILAIITILYAITGMIIGKIDIAVGWAIILGSLQVMGLRAGISNQS